MLEINSYKRGLKDGIPIFLGYLSASFAFGIFAVNSGLYIFEAVMISMTNLTSAGQLAGIPIIVSGGTLIEMALTQFIINLRYSLMSITLSQKLSFKLNGLDRAIMGFFITDEIFGVASSQPGLLGKKYFLGLSTMPYIGWAVGTLLGAVAGNTLPHIVVTALGVSIYGMFVAILIPQAKCKKPIAFCMLMAVAVGCVLRYVPIFSGISEGFVIIISAVSSSVLFAIISPVKLNENVEVEKHEN